MPADPGPGTAELLRDLAALAAELGDASAAELTASQAAAAAADAARVVVVGEKKRGKSSLINALLRRPGLLPVDSDIATSVHVTVYAADADRVTVIDDQKDEDAADGADKSDDVHGFDVPVADIGEYAALDPFTAEMRHPGVREVHVGLDCALLRAGLQLIDTPGVGGLVAGHAQLTLSALSLADALLFVVSGSGELTRSEYEFLRLATQRVATVAFVLTQTDKYGSWPSVLAEDKRLVAEHAPQFAGAPWFPVSSAFVTDALEAAAEADPAEAAALLDRSGFGPLEQALTGKIAGRAAALRALNAVMVAQRVIAKLAGDVGTWQRSVAQDPALAAEVTAKKAALERYQAAGTWQRELDAECARLSQEMMRVYQKRLVDLQVRADEWISMATTESALQVSHDLDAGLRAMWADLAAAVAEGAARIAAKIAAKISADGVDVPLGLDIPYPDQLAVTRPGRVAAAGAPEEFSERVARLWPALSGFSITAMAAHTLLVGIVIPPLAIAAVGGLAAYILYEGNKKRAATATARAEMQRYVQGELRKAGAAMTGPLLDEVDAARERIRATVAGRLAERERELGEALALARRNQLESEQNLLPQRARAAAALARLEALDQRAAQAAAYAQAAMSTRLTGADAA